MLSTEIYIKDYLHICSTQKRLDTKTIRAYTIDLQQFICFFNVIDISAIDPEQLEIYIANLHSQYKPRTVKRKIASIKAFFYYCECHEILASNPFNKIQIRFREPVVLPKTISLHTVESFLYTIYTQHSDANTPYKRRNALRDIAVIELLFSTGMRISELCSLTPSDINLEDNIILIYGKGAKERKIQIGSDHVLNILREYKNLLIDCKCFLKKY